MRRSAAERRDHPVVVPFSRRVARASLLVALLASAVDCAILATDRDGRALERNRGAEAAFGREMADAGDCTVEMLFLPGKVDAGVPAIQMRAALDADGLVAIDGWRRRRDGAPF